MPAHHKVTTIGKVEFLVDAINTSTVLLNNDVAAILPLNTNDRTFITTDSNKTETGMTTFFTFFNKLNGYVSQINPVIQWVNDNVPFVNFSLLTQETVPTSSVPVANAMDTATFQNLTLSINDPALTLQNATLTSSGQLSLKVKITSSQTTVQSSLRYTYSDKFSTFSGTFPITVSNNQTVTIGSQIWMLRNLDVTTYRNGDPIPQVQDAAQWSTLTTGAWCYYENNTANGVVYGKLYNWYAVNDPRGLAPEGFQIPTQDIYNSLIANLGGTNVAGGALKESGYEHWHSPNSGATNSSGFTGLPSGIRYNDGSFTMLGDGGDLWTTTDLGTVAPRMYIRLDNQSAQLLSFDKRAGLAVRCIKN